MSDLGQAYVQIVPSAKGISGKITGALGGEMPAAGEKAGGMLGGALVGKLKSVITVAAIGATVTKAITEGAKLEQSYGGLDTIYGEAGEKAKQFAEQAAAMGISANNYAEQAVSFGASLKQAFGGDTEKAVQAANTAITDMTDNAAKMGTPIESIQNAYQGFAKQNYTMLDNLKLGYGGTKQEMERLLQDAGKLSGKKYDVSNLGDVYDAIHVIQGELNLTGTAAKEAGSTISGSFGAMKAAASNFLGMLTTGGNVNQALKQLVTSSTNFLFENLLPALQRIIMALPGAVGTFIQQAIPLILQKILQLIPQLLNTLTVVATQLATWIENGINKLASGKDIPAGGKKVLMNFVKGIIRALPQLGIAMVKLSLVIIRSIAKLPSILLQYGRQMLTNLIAGIRAKIPAISQIAKSIVSTIVRGVASLPGKLLEAGRRAVQSFASGLKSAVHMPKMHISWSTESKGSGKKMISIPKPHIEWYKTGGIFSEPSVIGVGEAGSEAVVPLDKFWNKLDAMADSQSSGGVINVTFTLGEETIGPMAVNWINGQTLQFNASPLAL